MQPIPLEDGRLERIWCWFVLCNDGTLFCGRLSDHTKSFKAQLSPSMRILLHWIQDISKLFAGTSSES